MRKLRLRELRNLYQYHWKSVKLRAGQDQKHFLHLMWPSAFPSFSALFSTRSKHKGLRVPPPQECGTEQKTSSLNPFSRKPRFLEFHLFPCQAAHQGLKLHNFRCLKTKTLNISFYL